MRSPIAALMTVRGPLLLLSLVLPGCQRDAPEREYGFVHMETTGLTQGLVAVQDPAHNKTKNDRDLVTIVFSGNSDTDAVKSLEALDSELLLPNANGDGIIVAGVLDSVVHRTSSGPGKPTSEAYQEFRLSRWYLRAPFTRRQISGPDEPSTEEQVQRLRAEDFDGRVGGDLSRFVRPR